MTIFKIKAKKILILFAVAAFSAAGFSGFFQNKSSAAGFSGKIFTSLFDGQTVQANKYSIKDAVYLNGGPQNQNHTLPDGTYYFQVTGPGGNDLLSTDLAVCRQLIVANGVIAAAEGPACQHATGIPQDDGSRPIKLMPFIDTPNPGGNYKAWLIQKTGSTIAADGIHINFQNNDSKSEVFRVEAVPCPNCSPTATLSGKKFYDANGNAVFDSGEVPVQGVQLAVDVTVNEVTSTSIVATDGSGNWSLVVPTGSLYRIGERLPYTAPPDEPGSYWVLTAPSGDVEGFQGYSGTASGNQINLIFGGACFRPSGIRYATPCHISYEPPPEPTVTPTPEPTPTPTPCPECPTSTLSGHKFYDANQNGLFNEGEASVQGIQIAVVLTVNGNTTITVVTTNADGNWSLAVPIGAEYLIGELLPDTGSEQPGYYWAQTAPAANDEGFRGYIGTASANQSGLNFGDTCFYPVTGENPPVASPTPCSVSYTVQETPTPTPTPLPDNW